MASSASAALAGARPVNTGHSLRNVARKRSWPTAELGVWRATCSWPEGPEAGGD